MGGPDALDRVKQDPIQFLARVYKHLARMYSQPAVYGYTMGKPFIGRTDPHFLVLSRLYYCAELLKRDPLDFD